VHESLFDFFLREMRCLALVFKFAVALKDGAAVLLAFGMPEFRSIPVSAVTALDFAGEEYPVLWVDALYEIVLYSGRVVSMAILVVCGVKESGQREILAIEPMLEESSVTYGVLFNALKERGLSGVQLIISDAHKGLVRAIGESFPGASWQRCKVHFMRNILANVTHRDKKQFASLLKLI
jgi:putative transposase